MCLLVLEPLEKYVLNAEPIDLANLLEARLALNFKGIEYETTWVEATDIAATLEPLRLEPNADGKPYTIPTVRFPDGTYVMDSYKIATELERRYPSPSLRLDTPVLEETQKQVLNLVLPLRGVFPIRILENIVNPRSAEWVERKREEDFGLSWDEIARTYGGEDAWTKAEPASRALGDILKAEGGPFALGKTVSYADFIIVGCLQFFKRVDVHIYERIVGVEPALNTLYEASATWLERDDH